MTRARKRLRAPYLLRRYGTYFIRVAVPADLAERVGLTEVRRSLGSSDYHRSRLLALTHAEKLKAIFQMMRTHDLTSSQCVNMIQRFGRDLLNDTDRAYTPQSSEPDLECREQRALAEDHLHDLEQQVSANSYHDGLRRLATTLLAAAKVDVGSLPAGRVDQMLAGTARALIERDRQFIFRLDEPVAEYQPVDPLFVETAAPSVLGGDLAERERPGPTNTGITVQEALDDYLKSKRREWTPKTLSTHSAKLRLLRDHLGGDRRVASVTSADLWEFADGLLRLRKNYHVSAATTFQSYQTEAEEGRISAVTADNILARTKSLFRWLHERAYIATNPAAIVRVAQPKVKKGKKGRRPFEKAELIALFQSPLFTGCSAIHQRFQPGKFIYRDAYFWLPILGYYTGARLGELVQLHVDDVVLNGTVPHLSINEDGSNHAVGDDRKHVKTEAGVRLVPLHPDVIKLGFISFVEQRRESSGKQKRLFREVKFGADGQSSTVMSKWFGRALDKVGLGDPTLVFHSFRHGMEDYFRNARQPQYITDRVIGHNDGTVSSGYGQGVSLEVAYQGVCEAELPVRLPSLWENGND